MKAGILGGRYGALPQVSPTKYAWANGGGTWRVWPAFYL